MESNRPNLLWHARAFASADLLSQADDLLAQGKPEESAQAAHKAREQAEDFETLERVLSLQRAYVARFQKKAGELANNCLGLKAYRAWERNFLSSRSTNSEQGINDPGRQAAELHAKAMAAGLRERISRDETAEVMAILERELSENPGQKALLELVRDMATAPSRNSIKGSE